MNFNELYIRLIESQQLELDFNAPSTAPSPATQQPVTEIKPDRVYQKWMITCASRDLSQDALYKRYERIQSMSHPQKKRIAFNCFMYAIKRRLMSKGFKQPYELANQGLPEYIAASEYIYVPRIKCSELIWKKTPKNTNQQ